MLEKCPSNFTLVFLIRFPILGVGEYVIADGLQVAFIPDDMLVVIALP